MLIHHRSKINLALVSLATILGAVARWVYITKSSIWHDEGFSIMLALRNPIEIWVGSARDVHPPLYYELLHYWMQLFGTSALAVRSLSALAGVIVVPLSFVVAKKMFGSKAGVLTSFFVALSPFLIRYSMEARMYGILSVFLLTAMYAVALIAHDHRNNWAYLVYALSIALGLYTHYFTALAVIAFWLYLMTLQRPRNWKFNKTIFLSTRWWLANALAIFLFLPWLPNMIAQLKRAQGLGWLSKTTIWSFHDTIWQFFAYDSGKSISTILYFIIPIVVVIAAVVALYNDKTRPHYSRLIICYSFVPIALAIFVSGFKPIFHERYFTFAVVGICMVLAVAIVQIARKKTAILLILAASVLVMQALGIRNVYSQSSHKMQNVIDRLNQSFQPTDSIVASELYVYFDGSYYNKTGQKIYLYTGNTKPNGYGESGLLYEKSVYVESLSDISSNRVWLIGKTGDQTYYNSLPSNWTLLDQYSDGYSEVRLYQLQ